MIAFAKAVTAINRLLYDAAKWLIYFMVAAMLLEVVARYGFGHPTGWAPELAVLIFGPYFLVSGPYVLHTKGHVAVDVVSSGFGPRLSLAAAALGFLMALIFGAILFWFALPLAIESWQSREHTFTTWAPPIWPVKAFVPFAMALLMLQSIAELVFLAGNVPEEDQEPLQ